MPDTTKVSTENVTVNKEEKIVQRIVELLNEKGYEYERDARPIICWKYNVSSSKELTLQQKEEVRNSLEDGTFEKWGMQYRDQVLNQQVDIVKQIENLRESTDKIETEINKVVKETEKIDSKKIKLNLGAKSQQTQAVGIQDDTKDEPDDKGSGKIAKPASDRIKISPDTEKENEKKNDKKLIESAGIKIEPSDKGKTRIAKRIKFDTDKTLRENQAETPAESEPQTQEVKPDKTEQIQKVFSESETVLLKPSAEPAVQQNAVQPDSDETIKLPTSTRDRLKIDNLPNESVKMDIEEAKQIVKNCFVPASVEESAFIPSLLMILSLSFFGLSIYINFLILMNKNLPSWLKLVCKIFE